MVKFRQMAFDYLFLPMLILIAAVTAYQDWHWGKIKNKWIVLGLAYGLAVLALFFFWDMIARPVSHFYYLNIKHLAPGAPMPVFTVSYQYLSTVLINLVISILAGFAMWRFRAWSAGDAKLFFVFALLLPLRYYSQSFLPFFPSFALLANIFIPVFVFFAFKAAVFVLGQSREFLREKKFWIQARSLVKENFFEWTGMLMAFLAMFLAARLFLQAGNYFFKGWAQAASLALLFLLGRPLSQVLKKRWAFWLAAAILGSIIAAGFFFYPSLAAGMLWQMLKTVLIFMIFLGLVNKALDLYVREKGVKNLPIGQLDPGAHLTKEFLEQIKSADPEKYAKIKESSRLGGEAMEAVKNFCTLANRDSVPVYNSFPFAVWMAAGLALTLAFKGSVLSIIFRFFGIL